MPAPVQPVFPALYLYPLNDSFVPKHISLAHGQRVKIGRQTNAKTAPGERNGYFDSKVLSRQHAEVWEEGAKIFIKDVKSSNGTFINGDRLSNEGLESDPYELKSDDIVEFGIDIVGEDNKTIIHHKVAARVVCVFSEQDVQVQARVEQLQQQQQQQQFQASSGQGTSMMAQPGPSNPNPNGTGTNFPFAPGQQRRPQMSQQGLAGMGGMGGSMRPPGKSGLTFDHILSRLQGELQKSRETGSELHTLTGAMNEIHDTLGGNLPANLPQYPSTLPPVRSQTQTQPSTQPASREPSVLASTSASPEQVAAPSTTALTASTLVDLQTKLQETQSSLSSHVDKIRALEDVLAEHETIKREVKTIREMMETRRQERETEDGHRNHQQEQEPRGGFDEEDEEGVAHDDDDDDARSIATIVPHELERVEEENEEELAADAREQDAYSEASKQEQPKDDQNQEQRDEQLEDEEERRRRNDELGRPRTPEPTNLGLRSADQFSSHPPTSKLLAAPRRSSPSSPLSKVAASSTSSHNDEALDRVLEQVGALMTLTTSLASSFEAQHTAAQNTISALESKVSALEATVTAMQETAATPNVQSEAETPPPAMPITEEKESLSAMVLEWKKSMEGQWSSVREDWDKERERLNQAREQWEGQVRSMDTGLEKLGVAAAAIKTQQDQIFELQLKQQAQEHVGSVRMNGDAANHIGLVTPPSPRSLSSDSNRPRRRKSSGSRRGRSGQRPSRSRSAGSRDGGDDDDTDATLASEEPSPSKGSVVSALKARVAMDEDDEDTVLGVQGKMRSEAGAETLATPDSSMYLPSSRSKNSSAVDRDVTATKTRERELIQLQTAIGVIVLSVAAAAVIWRVKPET